MTITSSTDHRLASSSSPSPWIAIAVSSLVAAAAAAVGYTSLERRRLRQERSAVVAEWQQKRQEERTGRIRAEIRLREALSKLRQLEAGAARGGTTTPGPTTGPATAAAAAGGGGGGGGDDPHAMSLSTIGTVLSPYPKRMGTPRQGALVPTSRGCIQFRPTLPPEAVDGIEAYGHLWVIFAFHENTSLVTSKKTKVRPPRGGGVKVGQLATRSPHRPNPLGLSLVRLDRWEPSTRRLHITGLDLVDGTPVYDVKPYVQWDVPREVMTPALVRGLKLPPWVASEDDVLAGVSFEPHAEEALKRLVRDDAVSPLLYPGGGDSSGTYSDSLEVARQTLVEILAQDPRSSHRGLSKNQRGSLSADVYRLLFGGVVVEFVVEEAGAVVKNLLLADQGPNGGGVSNSDSRVS